MRNNADPRGILRIRAEHQGEGKLLDDGIDMYELEGHEGMLDNEHFISTTQWGTQSSEDMNSPRISQNSSPSHENMSDQCPTMPASPSAITDHPAIPTGIMMMPPFDRMLDAMSITNQFMVDAPMTWVVLESPVQSWFLPSSRENRDQNQFWHFKYSTRTRPDPTGLVSIGSYQFKNQSRLVFNWTSSPTNICTN